MRAVGVASGVTWSTELGVQRYGELNADAPVGTERGSECLVDQLDSEGVGIALGLADDQLARKQLEPLTGLEHALVDQVVVLGPRPAAGARICRLHAV